MECNTFSSNDSSNFLAFLQDFRKEIGSNKTITAAVGFNTFIGPDGNHMTDVSDFAKVFDHICGLRSPSFSVVLTKFPSLSNPSFNGLRF